LTVDYEPFSPQWRSDPYSKYRELRDHAPIHYAPESKVWCVSRYDDVFGVLNDPETFSSRAMFVMLMNRGEEKRPPISWKLLKFVARMIWQTGMGPAGFANARSLIADDGGQHSALRNIVNRGFTPRVISSWEPRVREITQQCLAGRPNGESFDLVRDLAIPLPVAIIAELLGIEPERHADFKRWSDVIVHSMSTPEGRADPFAPAMSQTFGELVSYLKRITRERRRAPADDLISTIVTHQDGGNGLTDYDVVNFVMLLLVAGNETTTNLIGNSVNALLDHPDQLEKLQGDPRLVAPSLEETLRFDAPIQLLFRSTTREVEMHGVTIPEGAIVAPLLGSANRDERQFPDPDRFDIERRPRSHLGFGFGEHFCLGSSLARLEARCAMDALLPELSKLTRTKGDREWIDSFLVRGPRSLELEKAA
jgi:cytochrome P450